MDKIREFRAPVTFAIVIAAMLGWAYIFGPNFIGVPAPHEVPQEEVRLVRIPLEEAFNISSQIAQLFVSISFGLFVIVGYALSRDQRNFRTFSVIDVVAGCAFIACTFICFYLVYQLRYGQYAAIQHRYTEDSLRQTIAWFNEVHAKLAFWVGVSAIPAFFIVARVVFVGRAPIVGVGTNSNLQEEVVQKTSVSGSSNGGGTMTDVQPKRGDASEEEKK
jgi:uncharacterized membrane protein